MGLGAIGPIIFQGAVTIGGLAVLGWVFSEVPPAMDRTTQMLHALAFVLALLFIVQSGVAQNVVKALAK